MSFFRLKKWYFDAILDNGDVLYFYFIRLWIAGFGFGLVSVYLSKSDHERLRAAELVTSHIDESINGLILGKNSLHFENGNIEVEVHLRDFSLKLFYIPAEPLWIPGGDGMLIDRSRQITSWVVPIPAANVHGVITTPADKFKVKGKGYHDLVEMTIPPWRLPLSRLWWGRAHFNDSTVVYNRLDFDGGLPSRNYVLIRTNHENERIWPCAAGIVDYPFANDPFELHMSLEEDRSLLSDKITTLQLDHLRVIEEGPLATATRIRPQAVQNLLGRISGSPYQTRFYSKATLVIDGSTKTGTALHELVAWNW